MEHASAVAGGGSGGRVHTGWIRFAGLVCLFHGLGCGPTSLRPIEEEPTPPPPVTEVCDGLDNNGDGLVDESFEDSDGDGLADCIDPPPCDGLELDSGGTVPIDAACALDPYALRLEVHYPEASGGDVLFGPVEDTNGDSLFGSEDAHAFVFAEREHGDREFLNPQVNGVRIVGESIDRTLPGTPLGEGGAVLLPSVDGPLLSLFLGRDPDPDPQCLDCILSQLVKLDLGTGQTVWADPAGMRPAWGAGPLSPPTPSQLFRGDLDGDGDDELLNFGPTEGPLGSAECAIALGSGDGPSTGSLLWWDDLNLAGVFKRWARADLDGDGAVEVLLNGRGYLANDCYTPPEMPQGTGAGPGLSRWYFPSSLPPSYIPLGDFRPPTPLGPAQLDGDPGQESVWLTQIDVNGGPLAPISADYLGGLDDLVMTPGFSHISAFDGDGTWLWSSPFWGLVNQVSDRYSRYLASVSADTDGDGRSEVFVQGFDDFQNIGISDLTALVAYDDDGSVLWVREWPILRAHGTAVVMFDFRADGVPELVLWVEDELLILDSQTGDTLSTTRAEWNGQGGADSMASRQRIMVIDVDNDGSAEVVLPGVMDPVTGQMGIGVYGHLSDRFPPTTRVWPEENPPPGCYAEDLTRTPECAGWWLDGRPSAGNIPTGSAGELDLAGITLRVTDQCAQCGIGGVLAKVAVQVSNEGTAEWDGDVIVEVRANTTGELLADTVLEGPFPGGWAREAVEIELPANALAGLYRVEGIPIAAAGAVDLCHPIAPVPPAALNCEQ